MHGPLMLDVSGTELTSADIELLQHPATGGVILFSRNFESRQQVHRLIGQIHELRTPPLLVAVDQEGGRVQRFRDGFTNLPAPAKILPFAGGHLEKARRVAHELGWLMAAELRSVAADFSFAPVLDLDYGVSEVIGDRAFGQTREQVTALAQAWMMGAREAGMISVGKHFPGHGAVTADSHLELPVDHRRSEEILHVDVYPFRKLIRNGLEGIMPAHVIYDGCDPGLAGFSPYWLKQVLRGQLGFTGVIFSDDLSMQATEEIGDFPRRAQAAIDAGCDIVLVCNNPEAAREVAESLRGYHNPVSMARCVRLHGRPAAGWDQLREQSRWHRAVELAASVNQQKEVSLDV
jgi:beta-N-acetylhexosaminidase